MSNLSSDTMTIEGAAIQLAESITACPEWGEFQRVNEIFEKDADLARMLDQYRQTVARVQGAQARGEETSGDIRQLEHLQIKIQQNPLFQQREAAADAMLSLLSQANAALTLKLGIDFAVNAQSHQHGGCCGGGGHGNGEGGCGCSH